jgi:hypothetical protein
MRSLCSFKWFSLCCTVSHCSACSRVSSCWQNMWPCRPWLCYSSVTDSRHSMSNLSLQYPIHPLYRFLSWLFKAVNCRMILGLAGYGWIQVDMVSKKKGSAHRLLCCFILILFNSRTQVAEKWNPRARDVIVSNWCSWAEILWLAFRYGYSEPSIVSL